MLNRPNEEETDEESFISSQTSDIGSPSSSLPPLITKEQSLDEIFKKPLPITSFEENSDLIGFRTRSKLPLNDTPLEHLEMAFVPPDISTDMYESDCDEEEWRKFLKVQSFRFSCGYKSKFHVQSTPIVGLCLKLLFI